MITFSYKIGFIHVNFNMNNRVTVQIDRYAYNVECRSVHAAKIWITKHANKIKGQK